LFLSYLPIKGKILEAGCGLGRWVIFLKQHGYDITGIDNSELAITKLKDFDNSLQVESGEVLDIHYPDNYFDALISLDVIEHFEDGPTSALKEAHRILKSNGLIFVSVPTVNMIRKLIRQPLRNALNVFRGSSEIFRLIWGESKRKAISTAIENILHWRRYYYFIEYNYSKSELENFLRQCNFEVITMVPNDFYGSKDHAIGLVVDFPFLRGDFQLNSAGKLISRLLDKISPWIACSGVLCIGRAIK
jgi:ubiquinone/menaquinone biosynthesis C-methylase UbiE